MQLKIINTSDLEYLLERGTRLGSLSTINKHHCAYVVEEHNVNSYTAIIPKVPIELQHVVKNYADIFVTEDLQLGCTTLVTHKIDTEGEPIKAPNYRCAPMEHELIRKEINRLHELNFVKPSSSPWSSPVLLVKKKDKNK